MYKRQAQGIAIAFACLPIGLGGMLTAKAQARCAAAGVSIVAKRPEGMAQGIVLAIMVEFYAILCLLASFLLSLIHILCPWCCGHQRWR